jgi:hypothetical protein
VYWFVSPVIEFIRSSSKKPCRHKNGLCNGQSTFDARIVCKCKIFSCASSDCFLAMASSVPPPPSHCLLCWALWQNSCACYLPIYSLGFLSGLFLGLPSRICFGIMLLHILTTHPAYCNFLQLVCLLPYPYTVCTVLYCIILS